MKTPEETVQTTDDVQAVATDQPANPIEAEDESVRETEAKKASGNDESK